MQSGRNEQSARTASSCATNEPGVDITDYMLPNIVSNNTRTSERQLVQSPLAMPAMQDVPPKMAAAGTTSSQLDVKIQQFYRLNIKEMFHSGVPRDDAMLERRAMLLYRSKEHTEDLELITRWLSMHEVKVSIWGEGGAWSQFRQDVSKGQSGIIIVRSRFRMVGAR